jgi:hypothetical protein
MAAALDGEEEMTIARFPVPPIVKNANSSAT